MTQLLTAAEVAAFTGLDEKSVRKDVEHGIVGSASPPRFNFGAVVYFRAMALLGLHLGTVDRKRIYQLIVGALDAQQARVDFGPIAELKLGNLKRDMEEKLEQFTAWKRMLVIDEHILGGEPVFLKSRLAVRQVGAMLLRGASPHDVREDYAYLTNQDLEFAKLFTLAYPRVGRPRTDSRAAHSTT